MFIGINFDCFKTIKYYYNLWESFIRINFKIIKHYSSLLVLFAKNFTLNQAIRSFKNFDLNFSVDLAIGSFKNFAVTNSTVDKAIRSFKNFAIIDFTDNMQGLGC